MIPRLIDDPDSVLAPAGADLNEHDEAMALRGCFYAALLSLPIWGLLGVLLWSVLR